MESILACYSQTSSDSDSVSSTSEPSSPTSPPPPPPPDLEQHDASKLNSLPILPTGIANSPSETFVLHIHIPILCKPSQLSPFISLLHSHSRLLFVNQSIKPQLTSISLDKLHISLSRATTISSRLIPQLTNLLESRLSDISSFAITIPSNPVKSFLSKNGTILFLAVPILNQPILFKLIDTINRVYSHLNLPPHFEHPQPHVSFAFTHTLQAADIINNNMHNIQYQQKELNVQVNNINCDIGKSRYKFSLS